MFWVTSNEKLVWLHLDDWVGSPVSTNVHELVYKWRGEGKNARKALGAQTLGGDTEVTEKGDEED